MKKILCKSCGDVNIVKDGNLYICQSCGSKYFLEESSVPGDTTQAARYLALALSAKEAGNEKESEKYAKKVLELDPKASMAWFLKGEWVGRSSTLYDFRYQEAIHCFQQALKYCKNEDQDLLRSQIAEVMTEIVLVGYELCRDEFEEYPTEDFVEWMLDYEKEIEVYSKMLKKSCDVELNEYRPKVFQYIHQAAWGAWTNTIQPKYDRYFENNARPNYHAWMEFRNQTSYCCSLLRMLINQPVEYNQDYILCCINLIVILEKLEDSAGYAIVYPEQGGYYWEITEFTPGVKEQLIDQIMQCHLKIKEQDPEYVVPKRPERTKRVVSKGRAENPTGSCYIATAVYGSYDCAPVWTLRRYRDQVLANCFWGRIFIVIYYALSPRVVRYLGRNKCFLSWCERWLNRFVKRLHKKGFDDTLYIDS